MQSFEPPHFGALFTSVLVRDFSPIAFVLTSSMHHRREHLSAHSRIVVELVEKSEG